MALDWLVAKLLTCKLLIAEWDQLQDFMPGTPHWLVDAAYLVKGLAADPTQQSEALMWTAWLPADPMTLDPLQISYCQSIGIVA